MDWRHVCRENANPPSDFRGFWRAARLLVTAIAFSAFYLSRLTAAPLSAAPQAFRWTPATPIQENKQFLGCSARFSNSDGLTLVYSLSNGFVWTLELSNASWKFAKGASFTVLLRIGDLYLSQPGIAVAAQTVRVQLRDSLQTFRTLSRAWEFDLVAGAINSHFSLAFGDRVLTDLVRCVEKREVWRAAKGIDLNLAAPPLQEMGKAFDKEAEALNSQILREAGFTAVPTGDLMPIGVRLHPNSLARVGANLVMTSVVPAAGFSDVQSLARTVIARDMRACRGEIFAGLSFEKVQQKPTARGYMNCRTMQSGISVHYVIVNRPAGGYFLVATLFSGPELVDATEQAAAAIDQYAWTAVTAMVPPLAEDAVKPPRAGSGPGN